jgi:hypothetical protein
LRTVVPKYGYWGGGTWGRDQFGTGGAPILNWVEAASNKHDSRFDHFAWAGTVLSPSADGLPPGVLGSAYALIGIPFFAAAGYAQRSLR